MKHELNEDQPIYLQVKENIEDSIINETIKAGERIPSTNEFAVFYKINPATAAKGVNELVEEDILFKRRGVGMFVTENARQMLVKKRIDIFYEHYMRPLKKEANKLGMTKEQLIDMVTREGTDHENKL